MSSERRWWTASGSTARRPGRGSSVWSGACATSRHALDPRASPSTSRPCSADRACGRPRRAPPATGASSCRARDGDTEAARAAIERAFSDRVFNIVPANGDDEIEPIRQAIITRPGGVLAFALLSGLAVAVFGGQAVARQSRREWADLPVLRALGLSSRQARNAAGLRGLVIGAAAAAIAVATALALSSVGSIGVARAAEVDPGLHADALVLAVGGVLVLVLVTVAAVLPIGRPIVARSRRRDLVVSPPRLRPPISAGIGMALNGGRGGNGLPIGAALTSVVLAAAALVAATILTASLARLTETPASFGAPWDFSFQTGEDSEVAESVLGDRPEVEAAAGIFGTDVTVDGDVMWAHALRPVPGVEELIRPVITAGRMPVAVDEIALGAISMRNLGVAIGDTVEMRSSTSESGRHEMTVVGTALINDSFEGSPGHRRGAGRLAGRSSPRKSPRTRSSCGCGRARIARRSGTDSRRSLPDR